jgi:hypothetical protein
LSVIVTSVVVSARQSGFYLRIRLVINAVPDVEAVVAARNETFIVLDVDRVGPAASDG